METFEVRPFARQSHYTVFDNLLLDYLMPRCKREVGASAWLVLCAVLRKTRGWQKEEDDISYSQLRAATGIVSSNTINRAVEWLAAEGVLLVQRYDSADQHATTYRLNREWSVFVNENNEVVDDVPQPREVSKGKVKDAKPPVSLKENSVAWVDVLKVIDWFEHAPGITPLRLDEKSADPWARHLETWVDPVVSLLQLTGGVRPTKRLMREALELLKEKGYTYKTPKSVHATAVNIFNQSDRAGDDGAKTVAVLE